MLFLSMILSLSLTVSLTVSLIRTACAGVFFGHYMDHSFATHFGNGTNGMTTYTLVLSLRTAFN